MDSGTKRRKPLFRVTKRGAVIEMPTGNTQTKVAQKSTPPTPLKMPKVDKATDDTLQRMLKNEAVRNISNDKYRAPLSQRPHVGIQKAITQKLQQMQPETSRAVQTGSPIISTASYQQSKMPAMLKQRDEVRQLERGVATSRAMQTGSPTVSTASYQQKSCLQC